MSAQPRVVLLRHGETDWSRTHKHTGRTDVPLTEVGRRQAEAAGKVLRGRDFGLVLCSPLERAAQTCALAGFADSAEYTDDLLEWHYGSAEGRSTAEMAEEVAGWTVWTHPVGGEGEIVEQVGVRADAAIARLVEADGDALVVAHGHMLRILAARWLGLDASGGRLFTLGTATLSVLSYEHGTRVIQRWNDDSHLREQP